MLIFLNTKKCDRCGLFFKKDKGDDCHHCSALTDKEIKLMLEEHYSSNQANTDLGLIFLLLAGVLGSALLFYYFLAN